MEKYLPLTILAVLLFALYTSYSHKGSKKRSQPLEKEVATTYALKPLKKYTTKERLHYIIDVINHGSTQLHFNPKESMDGGFATKEDAPKIACYILSFSGQSCNGGYPKEAQMYYSSNCAGCHGEDAKGIHGTYPDLTQKRFLGMGL